MKNLTNELIERFNVDQELSRQKKWEELEIVYEKNSEWLKEIISSEGWLSEEKVGIQGEQSAWLIVQHSSDIPFQKKCLKLIKGLTETKNRREYLAYLTDKILVSENKPQIYGTQFHRTKENKIELLPAEDLKNLNKRRKEMELEIVEYYLSKCGSFLT